MAEAGGWRSLSSLLLTADHLTVRGSSVILRTVRVPIQVLSDSFDVNWRIYELNFEALDSSPCILTGGSWSCGQVILYSRKYLRPKC